MGSRSTIVFSITYPKSHFSAISQKMHIFNNSSHLLSLLKKV